MVHCSRSRFGWAEKEYVPVGVLTENSAIDAHEAILVYEHVGAKLQVSAEIIEVVVRQCVLKPPFDLHQSGATGHLTLDGGWQKQWHVLCGERSVPRGSHARAQLAGLAREAAAVAAQCQLRRSQLPPQRCRLATAGPLLRVLGTLRRPMLVVPGAAHTQAERACNHKA